MTSIVWEMIASLVGGLMLLDEAVGEKALLDCVCEANSTNVLPSMATVCAHLADLDRVQEGHLADQVA